MKTFQKFAAIASAVVMMSSSAAAQSVQYSTTGSFTGCTTTNVTATFATCNVGLTELRYDFNTAQTVNFLPAIPVAAIQYGSFVMSSSNGSTNVAAFAGISFTMIVTQTLPSAGSNPVTGSINGSVAYAAGQLLWGPVSPTSFSIGAADYTVDVDAATQSVRINPPGVLGAAGDVQTIRGTVSVVPEPSTYALMAAGLAALGMVSRRRRQTV